MTSSHHARVISLQLCIGHREPMKAVERASLTAGFGIEGDRHATDEGVRAERQVLLMDEETLEGFGLSRRQIKENITTSGIELHSLKRGQQIALGDEVVLQITGYCAPCARMDEIRMGLREEMEERRGMLARVVTGGTIMTGDAIRVLETAKSP